MTYAYALLFFLLVACSAQKLPKYNELTGLRVLALVANPPEVSPGQTVTITPLVSDITEGSGLSFSAFSCMDYGIALGAEPSCSGNPTRIAQGSGAITTLTSARAFTGIADSVALAVPNAQTILALRSSAQQYNGVAYIFEYVLQNSRGEQVRSFKRLLVSDSGKNIKNANPVITDLLFNGGLVGSLPVSTVVTTSLSYSGTPAEAFQRMNSEGQLIDAVEELVTTWFVTDGKFSFQRTIGLDSNKYEGPPGNPIGRPAYLIGVTRDGRGGAHYYLKCFGTCN